MSEQLVRPHRINSRPTPADPEAVFRVLENPRCRALLSCLDDAALTVGELADCSDLPRSTLYRYLDRLVDASLVEESVRIDASGHYPSQYTRVVSDVSITLDGSGCSISLR